MPDNDVYRDSGHNAEAHKTADSITFVADCAECWRERFAALMVRDRSDALLWSFQHFYHADKANACMHCAPVRFSPVTFRCLDDLLAHWPDDQDITQEMVEVRQHHGKYELDPGR